MEHSLQLESHLHNNKHNLYIDNCWKVLLTGAQKVMRLVDWVAVIKVHDRCKGKRQAIFRGKKILLCGQNNFFCV